jgi:hypothetical protein
MISFDSQVNKHLAEGWTIIPGTMFIHTFDRGSGIIMGQYIVGLEKKDKN